MGMLMNRHRDRDEASAPVSGDGVPDKSWTNDQIKDFAKANDIDLDGATKKAEYLEVIDAHLAAAEGDGSEDDEPSADGDPVGEGDEPTS